MIDKFKSIDEVESAVKSGQLSKTTGIRLIRQKMFDEYHKLQETSRSVGYKDNTVDLCGPIRRGNAAISRLNQ